MLRPRLVKADPNIIVSKKTQPNVSEKRTDFTKPTDMGSLKCKQDLKRIVNKNKQMDNGVDTAKISVDRNHEALINSLKSYASVSLILNQLL